MIEPTNNSHQFFIIATNKDSGTDSGIVVHLDFNEYHTRECKGHDNPTDPDSDYENFTPHTYSNNECNCLSINS